MAGDRSVPSVDTGHHDHWAAHCLYSHSGPLVGYVETPSYLQCSTLMSDTRHEKKLNTFGLYWTSMSGRCRYLLRMILFSIKHLPIIFILKLNIVDFVY